MKIVLKKYQKGILERLEAILILKGKIMIEKK